MPGPGLTMLLEFAQQAALSLCCTFREFLRAPSLKQRGILMKHWGKRFLADGLVKTLGFEIRDVSRFPLSLCRGTGCRATRDEWLDFLALTHRSSPSAKRECRPKFLGRLLAWVQLRFFRKKCRRKEKGLFRDGGGNLRSDEAAGSGDARRARVIHIAVKVTIPGIEAEWIIGKTEN